MTYNTDLGLNIDLDSDTKLLFFGTSELGRAVCEARYDPDESLHTIPFPEITAPNTDQPKMPILRNRRDFRTMARTAQTISGTKERCRIFWCGFFRRKKNLSMGAHPPSNSHRLWDAAVVLRLVRRKDKNQKPQQINI